MKLSIVIPTFRRPAALRRCINSCLVQAGVNKLAYELVIVDNCSQKSARDIVHDIASRTAQQVVYTHEPRPGIAHARNHGVSTARAPLIAFIDDDECADPKWITQLLNAETKFDADIVFGQVVGIIEGDSSVDPDFVQDFYSINFGRQSGRVKQIGATGNVLLRRERCFEGGHAFNSKLGFFAGEDTLFFTQLARAGATIAWCREAVTYEMIPFRRTTPAYIWRRCIVRGQSTSLIPSLLRQPEWGAVAWFMMAGAAQFVVFGLTAGCLALFSRRWAVKVASRALLGLGKVLWMSPFRINYYGPPGIA
jgi:succinoglycan biosynthesis protein ExoM